jgi:hypothetical protein
MRIAINCHIDYDLPGSTSVILQLEAALVPEQTIEDAFIELSPLEHFARVPAHDMVGERLLMRATNRLIVDYRATVLVERVCADVATLPAVDLHLLPGETVQYLFGSQYCPVLPFLRFVQSEFGDTEGGARIAAIRDFVHDKLDYVPGSSDAETTALDTFVRRAGVCRDYAHMVIALARASNIPARLASVYAPGVNPPDFHAVAEVFLSGPNGGGSWQMVDATGMATEHSMAKIGVGRDAADVAFLTAFAPVTINAQTVEVVELK